MTTETAKTASTYSVIRILSIASDDVWVTLDTSDTLQDALDYRATRNLGAQGQVWVTFTDGSEERVA